jgi:hypothetical protein
MGNSAIHVQGVLDMHVVVCIPRGPELAPLTSLRPATVAKTMWPSSGHQWSFGPPACAARGSVNDIPSLISDRAHWPYNKLVRHASQGSCHQDQSSAACATPQGGGNTVPLRLVASSTSEDQREASRRVLGVYLSWRGRSLSGNAQSDHPVERRGQGTRLVRAGHSFGALILFFGSCCRNLIESVARRPQRHLQPSVSRLLAPALRRPPASDPAYESTPQSNSGAVSLH